MSTTSIPTDMTVQQWDADYFEEFVNKDFFKKFTSTSADSMIQVKEDLTKKPGDTIHVALRNKLKGKAKKSNELLEGQEEAIIWRDFQVKIDEYSHPVKWRDFDEQKTAIDLRQAHKDALMVWNMELQRDKIIEALGSIDGVAYIDATAAQRNTWLVNNSDRVLFGAAKTNNTGVHATSLANVDSTNDKLTSGAIKQMKRIAKAGSPKISPLMPRKTIDASDYFVLFINPLHERDLETDTTFMQANRDARTRGLDNPIFSGANYIFGNVAIYSIEEMPILTGVGAGAIDVAPVYLCGQQSLITAWAKRPWTKTDERSFGQLQALAVRQWYEVKKAQFGSGANDKDNLKDFGVCTGFFSAVAD